MPAVIRLKYPAACFDCGSDLEVGTKARYYGRGRVYGLECHGREDSAETKDAPADSWRPSKDELAAARAGRPGQEAAATAAAALTAGLMPAPKTKDAPFVPGPGNPYRPRAADRPKTKKETRARAKAPASFGKELGAAIRRVMPAVSTRPGIPALSGIMVECGADRTLLSATDLELTISAEIPTPERQPSGWRALVPAKMLRDAVKTMGSDERFAPDGDSFQVGNARIRTLAAEDWPNIQEIEAPAVDVDTAEFVDAIRSVAPAASKDDARPVLQGIKVEAGGIETPGVAGTLTLAATDSYRMHLAEIAADKEIPEDGALIPARALEMVAKTKDEGVTRLRFDGDVRVSIQTPDGTTYTSRLIDEAFPNYRQLIPDPAPVLRYGPELVAAVEAAKPFAQGSSPVRLEMNALGVRVTASSPDSGGFVDGVPADWSGEDMAAAYNPDYLLPIIRRLDPLEIRDGLKPAVARGPGRMGLVMPVRLPAPVNVPADPATIGR